MAFHALRRSADDVAATTSRSIVTLMATAVGTSFDAMAVAASLALLKVNILVIAFTTGFATATMSTGGMLAGRFLGVQFGRYAEIVGGLALVMLRASILFEHMSAG